MMRVLSSDDSSSNVAVNSNKTFDNNSHQQPMQFPRHITVEAPPLSYDSNEQPYVEHPLPGVFKFKGIADEVESYPCRHCPDRIFLTAFGLERHTKMAHPEAINEALADIENIQQEWKRLVISSIVIVDRVALVKLRQEALTNVVARGRDAAYNMSCALTALPLNIKIETNRYKTNRSVHDNISHSNSLQFQPCRICGIYINAQHQSAIINHIRAHSKNDQLRNNMLMEFGQQFVERVTCRECNLVFTDEQKLYAHIGLMHSRRRKYVCKWCGHVCMSMADLNVHKGDVHGMPVTRNRVEELRKRGAGVQLHITNNSNHHNNKKGVNIESSSRNGNSNDTHNNDANRNAVQTLNLSTATVNNSRTTNSSSEVNNSISSSNIIYSTNNSTSTVKLTPLMEDTPCRCVHFFICFQNIDSIAIDASF
ncbi:unnamed protein product [Anisakis simplex]|uniref:C2H2-type domain-containing protein n=1 Tax=Anisakis simplex TaxID=6269 RepID=A0A0M3JTP6_ANISI|nr:unnamed protein product [Anisakis simplex]